MVLLEDKGCNVFVCGMQNYVLSNTSLSTLIDFLKLNTKLLTYALEKYLLYGLCK